MVRQQGKGGKQQQQQGGGGGGGAPGDRAGKKAAFQQEGVHVNAEVLRASKEATAASAAANVGGGISAPGGPVRSAVPSAPNGFVDGTSLVPGVDVEEFLPEDLHHPRSCYCCKARFFKLHFFYSEFCPSCARLNYAKRNQMADLRGKVVLLTGSRVKIGFRCGLRLLRCGATLIATSRFPHDTARRYAEEKDFDQWKSRLHVFGLDLRDLKAVVRLSEILEQKYDRLDAIVNNAAQTVRRPVQYYRHLLPIECMEPEQMPKKWQEVVKGDLHALAAAQQQGQLAAGSGDEAHHTASAASSSNHGVTVEDVSHLSGDALAAAAASPSPPPASAAAAEPTVTHAMDTTTASQAAVDAAIDAAMASATAAAAAVAAAIPSNAAASTTAADALSAFVRHDDLNAALATTGNRAAALSQLRVLSDDRAKAEDDALFPVNRFDVTGQQLDLRTINSWNLPLDKVDPSELVEVFAINALSPFLLNSRLKNLMLRGGAHPQFGPEVQTTDKYIINVSAMEGKFYRHKVRKA
jgi:NAD(P)-dependent dehydrogenase (short-subunit alcohol dehydrogenase family)